MFQLQSAFQPAGDQPAAIDHILKQFSEGENCVTLLGATGTGKTFTMANIIQKLQKPTLIISHNKTLAAQLATEFKHFFPNNAVHYFVSYFDYYQPESYLPQKDIYIEKEATINKEIEMYRLSTLASLLSREDVIVVASVSALYGLGQKEFFEKYSLQLEIGQERDRLALKKQLLAMQYKQVASKIEQGSFEFKGEILDIYSSTEKILFRVIFNEDTIETIQIKDADSFRDKGLKEKIIIWPSSQYIQDLTDLDSILSSIEKEMEARVEEYTKAGRLLEANRIKKKVMFDTRMIKETGFTNGIENYSIYFDHRMPGEPPNTIFDYFPDDFLCIMDESHMSVPQLKAMPQADKSRKENLIEHGFRLPSAIDHRPLNFDELKNLLHRHSSEKTSKKSGKEFSLSSVCDPDLPSMKYRGKTHQKSQSGSGSKIKQDSKTIFVSATPAPFELEINPAVAQQVIRPTGLLDPITYIYPKSGDYGLLLSNSEKIIKKKPYLTPFLENYESSEIQKEIFSDEEKKTAE
ncbi:MAG TPA: DEAD/DEAH box helicase family protein [Candidatus Absconditabacterales bacterium]|nr:DEAD/DEAH box helicase family protein [Candidatus Absconditabacterales bacterium]